MPGFDSLKVLGLIAILVALLGSLASPSGARAATYTVHPCTAGRPAAIIFTRLGSSAFNFENRCQVAGEALLFADSTVATTGGEASWSVTAPGFSKLRTVVMDLVFAGGWAPGIDLRWGAAADNMNIEEAQNPFSQLDATYSVDEGTLPEGKTSFRAEIVCSPVTHPSGCAPASAPLGAAIRNIRVALTDGGLPRFNTAVTGGLFSGTARGVAAAEFTAEDSNGSGVYFSRLFVDGALAGEKKASSNGGCETPFSKLVPCPPIEAFQLFTNTTAFADGDHTAVVQVCDATELNCVSVPQAFSIDNKPENAERPTISGTLRVGATLSGEVGKWNLPILGSAVSFTRQWLRCPASMASVIDCQEVPGAGGASYVPVREDVGKLMLLKVTATLEASGHSSTTMLSFPSDPVAAPIVIVDPRGREVEPPQTFISKHPPKRTIRSVARFAFTSDRPGVHFECGFDKGSFRPCPSPVRKRLKPGVHGFRVRAVDDQGRRDPTPARFGWRRDG